jgi:transketolase
LKPIAMREAYGLALAELGDVRDDVVVLDADVSNSTRTIHFAKRHPDRFFNLGIAEANMVSVAAGLSTCGSVPFVNTFAFLASLRAADPVSSLVAHNSLNVKIAGSYAGLSDSFDGASHQSVNDIAIMRSLPNMTVVVAADQLEAATAVKAIADYPGPVYLRLSRAEVPLLPDCDQAFQIGKARIMRPGSDVTIVATGCMVHKALGAAKELAEVGIDAEVVEVHTIKPLDSQTLLSSASRTGAVVTAEEHSVIAGLGSAVAEVLASELSARIAFVGIRDTFAESGDYESLLSKYGLAVSDIVSAAMRLCSQESLSPAGLYCTSDGRVVCTGQGRAVCTTHGRPM